MAVFYYGSDFRLPIVDHVHERTHQHQNFFQYLAHRKARPEDYPNQPDVDVRDAFTEYLIEVEVPGVKDAREINVSWSSSRNLVVSGDIPRLESVISEMHLSENQKEVSTGTRDAHGDWKESRHGPTLLIGERKIGLFRRHFNFPEDIVMEKMTAKLEAGLLRIRVPKKGHNIATSGKVDVQLKWRASPRTYTQQKRLSQREANCKVDSGNPCTRQTVRPTARLTTRQTTRQTETRPIRNRTLRAAQDLLCKKASIYSSLPMVPAITGSDLQDQYLPLLARDNHWRVQRKFAHTVLAQSSKSKYYGYIALEAKRYLYQLLQDPTDHYALTDRFCGRISARLAYGRPGYAAAHCKNASEFLAQLAPSGSVINLMPFLGVLPEWAIPSKEQVRLRRERETLLWRGLLAQAVEEVNQGVAPVSYVSTYLSRQRTEKAFGFDDDEAAYVIGMLCTVSIFTIGGALYEFILAMVLHPEWQQRVREEVDSIVTDDGILELSNSPKLPTLRAAIKECFRWRPVVPLGVPHLLEKDDEYNGHYLLKGAIVHAVELSMARDEEIYPDAETYDPSRWLDSDCPTYKEPLRSTPG